MCISGERVKYGKLSEDTVEFLLLFVTAFLFSKWPLTVRFLASGKMAKRDLCFLCEKPELSAYSAFFPDGDTEHWITNHTCRRTYDCNALSFAYFSMNNFYQSFALRKFSRYDRSPIPVYFLRSNFLPTFFFLLVFSSFHTWRIKKFCNFILSRQW